MGTPNGRAGVRAAIVMVVVGVTVALSSCSSGSSAPSGPGQAWVGAWGASPVIEEGVYGLVGNLLRKPVPADPQYGVPALDRLDRDVFSEPGVRDIILLEGVKDLAYGATASEIISADKQIIAKAHARGLRIFGGTLTPFKGSIFDNGPAYEATRDAVNKWIMTSHAFDGVIDFASAVASPASPQALKPAFDSGDHSHPSDAGYQAMANAINLSMLLAGSRA